MDRDAEMIRNEEASRPNRALRHHPDGFRIDSKAVMGRQCAGAGFIKGFLEHGGTDRRAQKISLANDLRELARVAARIDEFSTARDLGPQVDYAVNPSVGEILTNAISRGYDDDELHRIEAVAWMEGDAMSSCRVTVRSWMQ